jgi:hypothetical protein
MLGDAVLVHFALAALLGCVSARIAQLVLGAALTFLLVRRRGLMLRDPSVSLGAKR